ncbi:MAG: GspE/PulE family protein [Phycisphaerales bacterium]|nr:GspE/PulE family protein [Phycisphaerales bacterium]
MALGTILVEQRLLTDDQLATAIVEQERSGQRLDHVLVRLGMVSDSQVLAAIGEQFSMPVVDLQSYEITEEVLTSLPAKLIFKKRCVPLAINGDTLQVATSDPFELTAFDELRILTGKTIDLVLADETNLRKFIRRHYGVAGDTLDALTDDDIDVPIDVGLSGAEDELGQAQEASVIKLVNDLLVEAIRERATDIHIEPYEDTLIIRYRIDGILISAGVPTTVSRFRHAIISRIKIMANLNIAEKRRPQDGRILFRYQQDDFDLRASVIPMLFGEGIVLRLLNKSAILLELEDLGMPRFIRERWDDLIGRPHGILLVTGPTGSGKSTTLYASLNRIVSDSVKAITVEDPVEYHVDGVNQIQVHHDVGLNFAAGLRAILRHDPDIVMIGEIRDQETAEAAIQASLTGHLVFSTLHTNDAASATTRLLDMGVEPFLVSSSLEGVLAQRLVRRVCSNCAEHVSVKSLDVPASFKARPEDHLRIGKGCGECRQTGLRGRIGLFELLRVTEDVRTQIMERTNASTISKAAEKVGDLTRLIDSGLEKVRAGETTFSEVLRVTRT